MENMILLWADLNSKKTENSHRSLFETHFDVHEWVSTTSQDQVEKNTAAICFDYDYPDMSGLNLLRLVRAKFPWLPVIMMTEQHSESLAVWALRMRVWDFIVKPLDARAVALEAQQLKHQLQASSHWENSLSEGTSPPRIPQEARYYKEGPEERAINPAIAYIQQHFTEKITEEQMAGLCLMRPAQFSRHFKKHAGMTFQGFVQRTRVDEAIRLLKNPNITILDVALTAGFRDQSYFTRVFKKHTGTAPTLYREKQIKVQTGPEDNQQNPAL
ncbi:MAG: helix-turn-helix domain-containing protein [Pontibacterium sp.]